VAFPLFSCITCERQAIRWIQGSPLGGGGTPCIRLRPLEDSATFPADFFKIPWQSFSRLPGIMPTVMLQQRYAVISLKHNPAESGRTFAVFRVVAYAISGINTVSAKYTAQHVNEFFSWAANMYCGKCMPPLFMGYLFMGYMAVIRRERCAVFKKGWQKNVEGVFQYPPQGQN